MKITFYGAAGTVTGSCYLVELPGLKFIVDSGMFQGREVEERNLEAYDFNPSEVDFLILTHAHMDHVGLLPKLVKHGFRGPIYTTSESALLGEILLLDAAKIQEQNQRSFGSENAKWVMDDNKKRKELIYDTSDALNTISMFQVLPIHTKKVINDKLSFEFVRVGHILGSVSVAINVNDKQVVFSGDIGRTQQSIIQTFTDEKEIYNKITPSFLLMESLYGGKIHPSKEESIQNLLNVINETLDRNANVIIPSFAVHRTQELLEILKYAFHFGLIKKNVQVFLDSPLAILATQIYTNNTNSFNDTFSYGNFNVSFNDKNPKNNSNMLRELHIQNNQRFTFENLRTIKKSKQSLKIALQKPAIIIAGSGMADGGRVLHHLAVNLPDAKASVAFVGFQAKDTLGRELVEGAKMVVINKKQVKVNAQIHFLQGFSAHGDESDLLKWLKQFNIEKLQKIFLVHAEPDQALLFQQKLTGENVNSYIPQWKETVELDINY